jgi:hypothetical protein
VARAQLREETFRCRIVGESQSVLIMISPIIFPRRPRVKLVAWGGRMTRLMRCPQTVRAQTGVQHAHTEYVVADMHVQVVGDTALRSCCAHCFKQLSPASTGSSQAPPSATEWRMCSSCQGVGYCSRACEAAAQPLHALECTSLRQVMAMCQGRESRGARMLVPSPSPPPLSRLS